MRGKVLRGLAFGLALAILLLAAGCPSRKANVEQGYKYSTFNR